LHFLPDVLVPTSILSQENGRVNGFLFKIPGFRGRIVADEFEGECAPAGPLEPALAARLPCGFRRLTGHLLSATRQLTRLRKLRHNAVREGRREGGSREEKETPGQPEPPVEDRVCRARDSKQFSSTLRRGGRRRPH
jgi:hypothetical protein